MAKEVFYELLNSYGDRFDRKNSEQISFTKKDALFNLKETFIIPKKKNLKQELKNQKFNSFTSKQNKKAFREWKKSVYKQQKIDLAAEIIEEKSRVIRNFSESKKASLKNAKKIKMKVNWKEVKAKRNNLYGANLFEKFFLRRLEMKMNYSEQVIKTFSEAKDDNYDYLYKCEIAETYLKYGDVDLKNRLKMIADNSSSVKTLKRKLEASKNLNYKEVYKKEINSFKKAKKDHLAEMKNKSSGNMKAYFKQRKGYMKSYRKDLSILRLSNNPSRKIRSQIRELKKSRFDEFRKSNKLLKVEIADVHKKIPVEFATWKYWTFTILGFILPGLSELFLKKWISGIIKLAITGFILGFVLPYVFGAFPSAKGNGVIGLQHFGASKDGSVLLGENDGRFFLLNGVLSIIYLFLASSWFVIAGSLAWNRNKKMRLGIREPRYGKVVTEGNFPYLMTAPAMLFILFIVVMPLLATIILSFTNYNQVFYDADGFATKANGITIPFKWVDFEQYKYITKVVGPDFGKVLGWTLIWTLGATCLTLFMGTLYAILVNQKRIKGKAFIRVIYILPWAIPGFVSLLFFSIYFEKFGIFNETIGKHLFGRYVDWKREVNYEKTLLIFIQMWIGQAYIFILITGMLQSIPTSLYEASRIDGASDVSNFRRITMPLIVKAILPLLIGQFVGNFNNFNVIYLFNEGGPTLIGSTVGETDIFISWIYRLISGGGGATKPGAGAALSLLVSVFIVTPSAFIFFRSKGFREVK